MKTKIVELVSYIKYIFLNLLIKEIKDHDSKRLSISLCKRIWCKSINKSLRVVTFLKWIFIMVCFFSKLETLDGKYLDN
jgi:hypothetical protein